MSPVGRFRFSLETVLRVRSLREEQARTELALSLKQLERSRLSLEETQRHWQSLLRELHHSPAREWASQDYQQFRDYLDHVKLAIVGWQERIKEQEANLERQKRELERLYQERRLLEQLREKRYRQYRREVMRVWEKEVEGLTLGRWGGRDQ